MLVQLTLYFALDHGPQCAHQKAEFGAHVHLVFGDRDVSLHATSIEVKLVSAPMMVDAILPGNCLGYFVDRGFRCFEVAAVFATDIDDGHGRVRGWCQVEDMMHDPAVER